jgi:hypothetical protein
MDITTLTEFLKYCTIINFTFLLISTITMRTDLIYNVHTKFGIWKGSKEAHKQLGYSVLGNYKILIMIFNAVPYFVLCCI